jgi:CIC family chloride channel protein
MSPARAIAPPAGRDDAEQPQPPDTPLGLSLVCATAILAGVGIGFIGGAFRWCWNAPTSCAPDFADWAHRLPGPSWLLLMAVTALGATWRR